MNFLLCWAIAKPDAETFRGGGRGVATRPMLRNCTAHFRRALEILQPTIIVVQGTSVREWLKPVLDEAVPLPRLPSVERVRVGDHGALLTTFVHPSAPTKDAWGANAEQPYLLETVAPTLRAVLRVAGISR